MGHRDLGARLGMWVVCGLGRRRGQARAGRCLVAGEGSANLPLGEPAARSQAGGGSTCTVGASAGPTLHRMRCISTRIRSAPMLVPFAAVPAAAGAGWSGQASPQAMLLAELCCCACCACWPAAGGPAGQLHHRHRRGRLRVGRQRAAGGGAGHVSPGRPGPGQVGPLCVPQSLGRGAGRQRELKRRCAAPGPRAGGMWECVVLLLRPPAVLCCAPCESARAATGLLCQGVVCPLAAGWPGPACSRGWTCAAWCCRRSARPWRAAAWRRRRSRAQQEAAAAAGRSGRNGERGAACEWPGSRGCCCCCCCEVPAVWEASGAPRAQGPSKRCSSPRNCFQPSI